MMLLGNETMDYDKCSNCQFWEPLEVNGLGECRRFPCEIIILQASFWYKAKVEKIEQFPVTSEPCWCGEYKRKE